MNFNKHFDLAGAHAFLSPSQYHWIRYDDAKLDQRFITNEAAKLGTEMHELAHRLIKLGVKLPHSQRKTLNMYVNDAIGYHMTPEQVLFYSRNCFGTADAISFKANTLRIHDLKTGVTPCHVEQLLVYAALFCLEYGFRAPEIKYDLRIYQSDEVQMFETDPVDIAEIMAKIIHFDKRIESLREEAQA